MTAAERLRAYGACIRHADVARVEAGALIQEAMAGMSRTRVAHAAGMSVAYVSEVARGKKPPSAKICDAVAALMEAPND